MVKNILAAIVGLALMVGVANAETYTMARKQEAKADVDGCTQLIIQQTFTAGFDFGMIAGAVYENCAMEIDNLIYVATDGDTERMTKQHRWEIAVMATGHNLMELTKWIAKELRKVSV